MQVRRIVHRAAAALGAAALSSWAHGFDCAPLEPSRSRAPAYRAVAGESRCEGFFEKKISQPFIELVSLTGGAVPAAAVVAAAAATAAAPLELRAASPAAVRLVIQPQRSSPFYRVDAALPAGQALRWDAAAMLAATGLQPADLGFLALLDGGALTPVLLGPPGPQPRRVTAVLRVSVAVSSVAWRSYRLGAPGANGATLSAWSELPNSRLFAWQRVALPIELPADGGGLRVDVQAVGADDGRALPLLQFAIGGAHHDAGP